MAPDDDKPDQPAKPDPTVKQLLERDLGKPLADVVDAVTAAELERWFGLPSFEQAAEQEKPEDPDIVAVRERRAKVLELIDPNLLAWIEARYELAWTLIESDAPPIESKVEPEMALFDAQMAEGRVAEPRDRERPEDIEEQLKDQTPQALLRDLHRAVLSFDKLFEIVDFAAEQTFDIVAEVRAAMATDWKLPTLGDPPSAAMAKISAEIREERLLPWANLPKRVNFPNRRVTE
ncbi:MAG: hypothetical protein IPQ07_34970 [Myxococcales bacterium]|nr:hypothetical protein [Myxococcales bacterium]